MTIKTYVKAGATWNPSKEIYVKSGGSWRTITKAWHRTAGVWELVHDRALQMFITANTRDYNIKAALDIFLGAPQTSAVNLILTVNPGVVVGSNSLATSGMTTGTFIPGTTITLINYGYVVGKGGNGGGCFPISGPTSGGPALNATTWPITVYNYGIIGGGGGGAGLGDCDGSNSPSGGGGAGDDVGVTGGGWGGVCSPSAPTLLLGGIGNWCWNGGDLGLASYAGYGGGLQGNAGAYIIGNANVTWAVPGDRRGLVS